VPPVGFEPTTKRLRVWCAVIFIILRGIESIDGLAQKLNFLTYFIWVAVFSIKAMALQT